MKRVADNLDPTKRKDFREKMREQALKKIEDRKKRRKMAKDVDAYLDNDILPEAKIEKQHTQKPPEQNSVAPNPPLQP